MYIYVCVLFIYCSFFLLIIWEISAFMKQSELAVFKVLPSLVLF